jgi:hypothetical protein
MMSLEWNFSLTGLWFKRTISWGDKGEIWDLQPPGTLTVCFGLHGDYFIFAFHSMADRINIQNTAR